MQLTFDTLSNDMQREREISEDAKKIVPDATDTEAIIAQLKSLGDAITNLSKRFDTLAQPTATAAGAPTNKELADEYANDCGKLPENKNDNDESEEKTE